MNSNEAAFDPTAFLGSAGPGRSIQQFRKNQSIFAQGDKADSVLFLQHGRVKLVVMSEQGKEGVVAILESGQFLGESALIGRRRLSTAVALEDCIVTTLTNTVLIATLQREPGMCEFFMTHLLRRNCRVEEDLIDQLFNSSEKRLARLLLLLADFHPGDTAKSLPVDVSQETLAEMIGTTRSRVSHFMNKFRKLGFIDYNGHIEVYPSLRSAVSPDKARLPEGDARPFD
ncbi:transcriptional regulator, Crp/Fnr family [Rhodopseudomonas palustris HaA2]|uniref:Transcriptional regulator, Crp/Fnr family n=1 Tax=Rhodopseudomonas palustris (strain HaA2) TaxID=316058 RepID=Q2ITL7_RHOP2|nr:Crp/Fnr family transcriptional regulator [Rhodopseudomonas palustris]ABD08443.1 transcriptional regulator, Crp/Fnr family [Rhodopseudomonas palustris HaA2]